MTCVRWFFVFRVQTHVVLSSFEMWLYSFSMLIAFGMRYQTLQKKFHLHTFLIWGFCNFLVFFSCNLRYFVLYLQCLFKRWTYERFKKIQKELKCSKIFRECVWYSRKSVEKVSILCRNYDPLKADFIEWKFENQFAFKLLKY